MPGSGNAAAADQPLSASAPLTASFDIGLLNALLAYAASVAAVCVRLQSSGDGTDQSVVSWSIPVADLIGGLVEYRFNVANPTHETLDITFQWQLVNLNSDLDYPSLVIQANPLALVAKLPFYTYGTQLKGIGAAPDIQLQSFTLTVAVSFDGLITPACVASASFMIAGEVVDVSGDIESSTVSSINSKLSKLSSVTVSGEIDKFFTLLLRLNGQTIRLPNDVTEPLLASILQYSVEGDSLVVTYTLAPPAPAPSPRPSPKPPLPPPPKPPHQLP
jgi:hypothetical protein